MDGRAGSHEREVIHVDNEFTWQFETASVVGDDPDHKGVRMHEVIQGDQEAIGGGDLLLVPPSKGDMAEAQGLDDDFGNHVEFCGSQQGMSTSPPAHMAHPCPCIATASVACAHRTDTCVCRVFVVWGSPGDGGALGGQQEDGSIQGVLCGDAGEVHAGGQAVHSGADKGAVSLHVDGADGSRRSESAAVLAAPPPVLSRQHSGSTEPELSQDLDAKEDLDEEWETGEGWEMPADY